MSEAKIKVADYENIYLDCPACGKENIYNRKTDLDDNFNISRLEGVICKHCKSVFTIKGDRVTFGKWCWVIDELSVLKERKEYRMYILNLCQTCEIFFCVFSLNKILLTNPSIYYDCNMEINNINPDEYEKLEQNIENMCVGILTENNNKIGGRKFKDATFDDLRKVFLYQFNFEKENDNGNLKKIKEDKRIFAFDCIKNTDINKKRNEVIHKKAYRPSLQDVEKYNDLISSLHWLKKYLK